MNSPGDIKSLFTQEQEEPDWLTQHRRGSEQDDRVSESSEDPFDLTAPSPSKPAVAAETPEADPRAASTFKAAQKAAAPAKASSLARASTAAEANQAAVTADNAAGKASTSKAAPDADGTPSQTAAPKKGAPSSRAILKNPAVLRCQRLLVELPGDKESAVDLAGDSGAVGRMSIQRNSDGREMLLDLKGVLYKASLLPMACTACIVNINQSDAKVEAFCNEFLQLEKSSAFGESEVLEDGTVDDWIIGDDHVVNGEDKAGDSGSKGAKKVKVPKKSGLGVSSGKVVKVAVKKKPSGAAGKGKSKSTRGGKGKRK